MTFVDDGILKTPSTGKMRVDEQLWHASTTTEGSPVGWRYNLSVDSAQRGSILLRPSYSCCGFAELCLLEAMGDDSIARSRYSDFLITSVAKIAAKYKYAGWYYTWSSNQRSYIKEAIERAGFTVIHQFRNKKTNNMISVYFLDTSTYIDEYLKTSLAIDHVIED